MVMLVPPKWLSLEAARGTELNTAAWASFDAVRAATQRTAQPQNSEIYLTRADGRTVRLCHDDCPYADFILALVDRHLRYPGNLRIPSSSFVAISSHSRAEGRYICVGRRVAV
jgi:hypothetical protein